MKTSVKIVRRGFKRVLEIVEENIAPIKNDEVRIDVAYAGVNFADVVMWRGFYKPAPKPPFTPGFEVSGTVREVGSDVKNIKIGDRVMAATEFGGYTTSLAVPFENVRIIDDNIEMTNAAGFPATYMTAWVALKEFGRIKEKETVLIHAVAGGLGIALTQIAHYFGATTIGTASADEKITFAKQHGLEYGINYSSQDFAKEVMKITNTRGVDICIDSVGGALLSKNFKLLTSGGRLVIVGAADLWAKNVMGWLRSAWKIITSKKFKSFELLESNKSVIGVQLLNLWKSNYPLLSILDELTILLNEKKLNPVIDKVFDLKDVEQALKYVEQRKTKGKVLLKM